MVYPYGRSPCFRPLELDVLLLADVVWLSELVEPLVTCVAHLAQRNPLLSVLVVHQTRSRQVDEAFLKHMKHRGFVVETGLRWHEELSG